MTQFLLSATRTSLVAKLACFLYVIFLLSLRPSAAIAQNTLPTGPITSAKAAFPDGGLTPSLGSLPLLQTRRQAEQLPPILPSGNVQAGDYFRLQKKICRWSDQTKFVLVYISTAEYLPDWRPWNVQIVRDALGEWQRALNNRLMFVFMNDPSQADVIIHWWNVAAPNVEKGASGMNSYHMWGKYLAQNDVYLSLHNEAGQAWEPDTLYATALHETGHMIGIREHSDQPGDIMYPITTTQRHLSPRDMNTLNRIYATKAHYTNPPGYHLSHFKEFQKTQKSGFFIPIVIPIPL